MMIQSKEAPSRGPDWVAFGSTQSREQFLFEWLAILCSQIGDVRAGLLLLNSDQEHTFVPGAVWPGKEVDLSYLAPVAQGALTARRGQVTPYSRQEGASHLKGAYVVYPVEVAHELKGAVVLDVVDRPSDRLQHALRLIHWGQSWLVDMFRQKILQERDQKLARLTLANSLMASVLQEPTGRGSALVLVNELSAKLGCDRVSLGYEWQGMVKVEAISHTAIFDPKAKLIGLIAEAMDEVLDAHDLLVYPSQGDAALTAVGQSALAQESQAAAVLSVPLIDEGQVMGVLTLERHQGAVFTAIEIDTCQVIGLLMGPILAMKRIKDRSLTRQVLMACQKGFRSLFGAQNGGVKMLAGTTLALLLALALVTIEYRVTAKTVVEGEVQIATSAPFDGFIAQAFVQAGDVVRKGQVMARLDDKDLHVERARWLAEFDQYTGRFRQAQANHERASMNVLAAQVDQARAQLQLVESRLSQASMKAPFDGVVVSGDLRQLIGTPVEMGKVLFETAPLDAYRVILQVDERDIAHLQKGQKGELALSGIPGERFQFTVKQVTPVAVAEDGRNFFRVEAQMEGGLKQLRPGMEGIGKVAAGSRHLIWVWTHSLVDWVRLTAWNWLP